MTALHQKPLLTTTTTSKGNLCGLIVATLFLPLLPLAISAAEPAAERPTATPAATKASQRTSAMDAGRDVDVDIIAAEDRVIYEYRVNGVITAIKVVPKNGRPYYMVPIDGSPHYEINPDATLYPKWILLEW